MALNIFCPDCEGTSFMYERTSESTNDEEPHLSIVTDKLRCKDRRCGREFNITWYEYVREEWLQEQFSERRFKKRIS